MMDDLIFQKGSINDLETCLNFDKHINPKFLTWKLLNEEIFLALNKKEIIGYLRLEYIWTTHPFIGLIILKEEFRGKQIGKNMLEFLEEQLRLKGQKKLYSSSQANETAPQQWHIKMGFNACGIINGMNENEIGEVFFCKILQVHEIKL
ncbi:N-acetylglutamate synthase-like GNAT family acetyltransferase [Pedobacter cryoconitis]|uniref:GNAT family N-acetyltransferase n=1 Tax=Pedobacter cryoconitis TaxID=188932 RepID=UPI0016092E80|nr:GNAT family N-acetyltransferase [Pedobacter cryoconitis]MBB6273883.1 N-acetylglutamate synthase-like GNAT family acetyltransferase [Pedobacter cryoconitis]